MADPNDPYAVPAAMPSSADRAPRSFDLDAFAMPTSRQEEWRYTPLDRVAEFLDVFEPSGLTTVEVTGIDGSPLDPAQVGVEVVDRNRRAERQPCPSRATASPRSNGTS